MNDVALYLTKEQQETKQYTSTLSRKSRHRLIKERLSWKKHDCTKIVLDRKMLFCLRQDHQKQIQGASVLVQNAQNLQPKTMAHNKKQEFRESNFAHVSQPCAADLAHPNLVHTNLVRGGVRRNHKVEQGTGELADGHMPLLVFPAMIRRNRMIIFRRGISKRLS